MSEPLRVALVCEGPTDKIVLSAILPGLLGRPVVVTMVQPMEEELSGGGSALGFGWRGVRRWSIFLSCASSRVSLPFSK